MEINITIFIQALILLMLLLILCETLFKPFGEIFYKRSFLIKNEKIKIFNLENTINKQEAHIKKKIFFTENRAKKISHLFYQESIRQRKRHVKILQIRYDERHKNTILKLKNEIIIAKVKLN